MSSSLRQLAEVIIIMAADDKKAQVQAQFGAHAQDYADSKTHAQGAELSQLVALAQPQPDWQMLDVAAGGGHVALAFAPYVRQCIACDMTLPMLQAARQHHRQRGFDAVLYVNGDAEILPFAPGTFHLVTCRIAAHHFPDVFRFVQDCYRVLKPGGLLLVQDQVLPDDPRDAHYVDAFEKLRDPSHYRAYAEYEWRGLLLDGGFEVLCTEVIVKRHDLISWAQRTSCTPDTLERLQVLLLRAPDPVAAWMLPEYAGTAYATFCNRHLIILGRKGEQTYA